METTKTKDELIQEFTEMKALEKSAQEFYLKIVNDPGIKDEQVKNILRKISQDEKRHAQLVQEIINIIQNNL